MSHAAVTFALKITEQVALHARLKEAEAKGRALRQELETASQQIAIFKEPKLILGPEGGHSDRGARGVGLGSAAPPQSTSTVEEHNMLVAELHATLLARDSMINALRMELSRQHTSMANLHQTLADLLRQHQATVGELLDEWHVCVARI